MESSPASVTAERGDLRSGLRVPLRGKAGAAVRTRGAQVPWVMSSANEAQLTREQGPPCPGQLGSLMSPAHPEPLPGAVRLSGACAGTRVSLLAVSLFAQQDRGFPVESACAAAVPRVAGLAGGSRSGCSAGRAGVGRGFAVSRALAPARRALRALLRFPCLCALEPSVRPSKASSLLGSTGLGAGQACLPPNVSEAVRPTQTVCCCTELSGKH